MWCACKHVRLTYALNKLLTYLLTYLLKVKVTIRHIPPLLLSKLNMKFGCFVVAMVGEKFARELAIIYSHSELNCSFAFRPLVLM